MCGLAGRVADRLTEALGDLHTSSRRRSRSPMARRPTGSLAEAQISPRCYAKAGCGIGSLGPPAEAERTGLSSAPSPPRLSGNLRRSGTSPERAKAHKVAWLANQEPELELLGLPESQPLRVLAVETPDLGVALHAVAGRVAGGEEELRRQLKPLPRSSRRRLSSAGASNKGRR